MSVFPLPNVPAQPFDSGGLAFANQRETVVHAACDLIAPAGTPVFAIDDGVVWYGPRPFFQSQPDANGNRIWTFEMAVVHPDYIIRYGEIGNHVPAGVSRDARVASGQQIASVGAQVGSTMLHLEMFNDTSSRAPLSQTGNMSYTLVKSANFNRRSDLRDPTDVLTVLKWALQCGWNWH
jgi:murein DD-endopeptidase MepM/ murein hydrolase activator NlpD